MAVALSWAVSHAEGRVTRSTRSAFTPTIDEFATHRLEMTVHRFMTGIEAIAGRGKLEKTSMSQEKFVRTHVLRWR